MASKRSFLPAWGFVLAAVGLAFLLILALQIASGRFATWLYAWSLLLAAAGLGFSVHGRLSADAYAARAGRRAMWLALALFALLALVTEIVIFGILGTLVLGNAVIPLVLLGLGIFVWRLRRNA